MDEKNLSIIVIKSEMSSSFYETLMSVCRQLNYNDNIEVILADAVDGTAYELCRKYGEDDNTLLLDKVRFVDISSQIFENMAQIKNEAVKYATNRRVLILTDNQILQEGIIEKCLLTDRIEVSDDELKSYYNAGTDAFSYLVADRDMFSSIGGWNSGLACNEDYELFIRACNYNCHDKFYPIYSDEYKYPVFKETFLVYAYILGKYASKLRNSGMFNDVLSNLFIQAKNYGIETYFEDCAKNMIGRTECFNAIDKNMNPVLMFYGLKTCNGTLNSFALEFAQALRNKRINVLLLNIDDDNTTENIGKIILNDYRCVIGMQTGLYTERLENGQLLGNLFKCPKFNYVFDHPLYVSWSLMLPVNDLYVLQQDETYSEYITKYYPYVKKSWHFPPAGLIGNLTKTENGKTEKIYDISFIATYNDYRERLDVIKNLPDNIRKISWHMVNQLKNHPNQRAEEALEAVLEKKKITLTEHEFVVTLHKSLEAVRTVTFYIREKIIKTLIESGINVDVFGDSWKKSPYADNKNLIIHDDIDFEKGLDIMAQSRISLNVMSWHKGGMTERIANAMLNYSVCVTDETSYINRHFVAGENIVTFNLDNIDKLPDKIRTVLQDENLQKYIEKNAYKKALSEHTWDNRSGYFMNILGEIEK